jgi:2-iminobutanoate/2-iminopropanoate deaminase
MATKTAVATEKAPPPLPFFSQAIKCNGVIYCSGSIGINPETKQMAQGGVGERTVRATPDSLISLSAISARAATILTYCS